MDLHEQLLKIAAESKNAAATNVEKSELIRLARLVTGETETDKVVQELVSDAKLRSRFLALAANAEEAAEQPSAEGAPGEVETGSAPADTTTQAQSFMQSLLSTRYGWAAPILSVVITVGFFVILSFVLLGYLKPGEVNRDLVFLLVGTMTAAFTQVVNFWLGSSKGSTDKTSMLVEEFARARPTRPAPEQKATGKTTPGKGA